VSAAGTDAGAWERRVVVTGAGLICPLADAPRALHEALVAQRSARRPVELFPVEGLGDGLGGEIRPFAPESYLGDRNLRPLDRTSRLTVVAAQLALADAESGSTPLDRSSVGLVLGTMFCSLRTIAEFDRRGLKLGPSHASPMDFANSVINAAAGQAAIWHALAGINSTVAAGEASGLLAIAQAADLIGTGRATAILAGGAEELCFESYFGMHASHRLCGTDGDDGSASPRPIPFDSRRNGFALGEAAAFVLLEEATSAAARGARVRADVAGWGAAFDGTRGARTAAAVAGAIRQALTTSGTAPEQIGFVSTSASGSRRVDRSEAAGLARALGARGSSVPISAIKAMLCENLGASGALQVIDAVETLADRRLPGIAGLGGMEPDFPLGGTSARTRTLPENDARCALITALGADGHCGALILTDRSRM
jgi:3-oxoacyl-[acyl-carrier-protein] synthase II